MTTIHVEVAYARPERQLIRKIEVPAGSTAEQAIRQSGLLDVFPEIDLASCKIGIFSKATRLDTELREMDRVEIYRPLLADPKEVRKQRAAEGKVMKKGGGNDE